jgi:L-fuculose-phosphate aldolase
MVAQTMSNTDHSEDATNSASMSADEQEELDKLRNEVERLRASVAGAADIIDQIENQPMPPIVGVDFVVPGHVVSDFVRMGRLLARDGMIYGSAGVISMLSPDEAGLVHMTRAGAALGSLTEVDIVSGRLGQEPPSGASKDWQVHTVLLAMCSLEHEGTAACIRAHGPWTAAMSLEPDLFLLKPIDYGGKEEFEKVVIVDPDYENMDDYLRQITEGIQQSSGSIVVARGHGSYALGANLDAARNIAATLEHSMHIYSIAKMTGTDL